MRPKDPSLLVAESDFDIGVDSLFDKLVPNFELLWLFLTRMR